MATSIPPQKAPSGWAAAPSSQGGNNANNLEVGMSGMSLGSAFSGGSRPPFLSGSSVSTGGDAYANVNDDQFENSFGITPPSPSSPLQRSVSMPSTSQGSVRPPGFGASLPSPIAKGSSAGNHNSSSPHLSLTPPASVDGNVDLFGSGKSPSPYFDGSSLPTPPNLDQSGDSARNANGSNSSWGESKTNRPEAQDGRGGSGSENKDLPGNFLDNSESLSSSLGGGIFSTGSFDPVDHDDGLRGLGALRDRSHSSPGPFTSLSGQGSGPYSSSPVLYRDSSPVYGDGSVGSRDEYQGTRSVPSDPRRSRPMMTGKSSSRPPLSGGATSTSFAQSQDGGSSYGSNPVDRSFSSGTSSFNIQSSMSPGGYGNEGFQQQGFGSLSKPELRYTTSDVVNDSLHGSRGRSMSLGASGFSEYREPPRIVRDPYNETYQQHQIEQLHAQKFASPQSLNAHIQQQRVPPHIQHSQLQQMQHQQPGRHVRSFSQPGPLQHSSNHGQICRPEDAMRYGHSQHLSSSEHRRNHSGGNQQFHFVDGESLSSLDGPRYGRSQNQNLSRSISAGAKLTQFGGAGMIPRSGHQSQPSLSASSSFEGSSHGKSSFHPPYSQNFSGQVGHSGRQPQMSSVQHGYDSGVPVMASPEEMRNFGIGGHDGDRQPAGGFRQERHVSPSHSPLNMTVGGQPSHIRQFSDGTGMSASPISIGSARGHGGGYGQNPNSHSAGHGQAGPGGGYRNYQRSSSFDDDLAHPLVGEHIDDPEDELVASMNNFNVGGATHGGVMMGSYGGDGSSFHGAQKGLLPPSIEQQMPPVGMVTHYSGMEPMHQHRHASASASSGPKAVYNVKFKRTQRCFIAGPRITRDLKIGCYVKVEADRGEDLGIVVSKIAADKFNTAGRSSFRGVGSSSTELTAGALGPSTAGASDLKRIIRLATHDEVSLLAVKREEEEELLKICRGKVRQRGLPMHVVDAEYQYDRHKLTFFFEAEGRIDFRDLVRDLFSMYKTRIWMQQLDKTTGCGPGSVPGIVTPTSGSLETPELEM